MSLSEIESRLTSVWEELLAVSPIDRGANFFDLGGDSVIAVRLSGAVKEIWKVELPLAAIFQAPTIREMAAFLDGKISPKWSPRVAPLKPGGARIPFLCVDAGPFFRPLTQRLSADQPFFGLRLADTDDLPTHFSLQDIAEYHLQTVRQLQPSGPYCLGGWSAGGLVAYEMAQKLRAAGQEVSLLVLFDVSNWAPLRGPRGWNALRRTISIFAWRTKYAVSSAARMKGEDRAQYVRAVVKERYLNLRRMLWTIGDRIQNRAPQRLSISPREPSKAVFVAARRYRPQPYSGRVLLFRSAVQFEGPFHDPSLGWNGLIEDLDICDVPGDHRDMFLAPGVDGLAEQLERRLCRLDRYEEAYEVVG